MLPAILMIELKMVLQTRYAAKHVAFPDVPALKQIAILKFKAMT